MSSSAGFFSSTVCAQVRCLSLQNCCFWFESSLIDLNQAVVLYNMSVVWAKC